MALTCGAMLDDPVADEVHPVEEEVHPVEEEVHPVDDEVHPVDEESSWAVLICISSGLLSKRKVAMTSCTAMLSTELNNSERIRNPPDY